MKTGNRTMVFAMLILLSSLLYPFGSVGLGAASAACFRQRSRYKLGSRNGSARYDLEG